MSAGPRALEEEVVALPGRGAGIAQGTSSGLFGLPPIQRPAESLRRDGGAPPEAFWSPTCSFGRQEVEGS
jgi:hypothetical protein